MRITITRKAFLKMKYYIEACPIELSGLGKVREYMAPRVQREDEDDWSYNFLKWKKKEIERPAEERVYEIYDIELLDNTATGTHATMSPETLARFMQKKMRKNQSIKDYKVWWHSHVDFDAFFSGIDTGTIEQSTEFPYLISIVGNKRGKFLCRFDTYSPERITIHPKLEIATHEDSRLRAECFKQVRKMVKEIQYTPRWMKKEDFEKSEPKTEKTQYVPYRGYFPDDDQEEIDFLKRFEDDSLDWEGPEHLRRGINNTLI